MEYLVRPSTTADSEALVAIFSGPKAAANPLQIRYDLRDGGYVDAYAMARLRPGQ